MTASLFARRVLFVGGKGGVGKTTTAAALALAATEVGKHCLLVSTDPAHSLGDLLERRIGGRETAIAAGLCALEIDPDAEVHGYIASVKQTMRAMVRPELYGEIDRQMDLAEHTPGAAEAALLERVADLVNDAIERFDLVIFDTAPTGHTVRLLSLPEIMAAWTDGLLRHQERSERFGSILARLGGKRREADHLAQVVGDDDARANDPAVRITKVLLERRRKFHRARRALLDPRISGFVLVLTPERLPILESRRAIALLHDFGIRIAALVVNQVLPDDADGAFLATRRRQQSVYLESIDKELGALPQVRLPLSSTDVQGIAGLRAVGRHLLPLT